MAGDAMGMRVPWDSHPFWGGGGGGGGSGACCGWWWDGSRELAGLQLVPTCGCLNAALLRACTRAIAHPAFSTPLLEPGTTLLNCPMMAPLHIINGKTGTSSLEKSLCSVSPTAESCWGCSSPTAPCRWHPLTGGGLKASGRPRCVTDAGKYGGARM